MSDRTEPEAERPARPPMDIGQLIVDRAKPVIREGGYGQPPLGGPEGFLVEHG